jgi:hypothetical protein
MEGHAPYVTGISQNVEPLRDKIKQVYGGAINEMQVTELTNILLNLIGMDEALAILYEELTQPEAPPTIVVLFGDHHPPMSAGLFESLGWISDGAGEETRENQFLIWSNKIDLKERQKNLANFEGVTWRTYMLPIALYRLLGWEMPLYWQVVECAIKSGVDGYVYPMMYELLLD